MNIAHFLHGSRFFGLTWLMIALGSCSIVQYNVHMPHFSLETALAADSDCHIFHRSIRLGHRLPKLPSNVDILSLPPEMVNDILLTHAEALHSYVEHEERYLTEDIERHRQRCTINAQ